MNRTASHRWRNRWDRYIARCQKLGATHGHYPYKRKVDND